MKNKFLSRILAFTVTVMLMFTLVPTGTVFADYPAFEFVVTSNEMSFQKGEKVVVTVTANGLLNNTTVLQYVLELVDADFAVTYGEAEADMDPEWFEYIDGGDGLGALDKGSVGCGSYLDEEDNTKRIYPVYFMGATKTNYETGTKYKLFIQDGDDIYGKTSTVVGKLVLTAARDISDLSKSIVLKDAKHEFGDKTGTLASKVGTIVQLKKAGPSQEAIDAMAEIAKIGTVTYTEASKALINAAQAKYDAVLDADKEEVTNANVLTDAKSEYDELKNAAIKAAISAIDAIGEVKYTDASKNLIDTAQDKYDLVLSEDKAQVTNASVLAAAKTSYAQIETQITAQVKAVEDAIDDLPEEITLADETAVNAAKANYLAISEEYRDLVTNYAKVEEALEVIASLKQQIEDVKADIDRLPAEITLDDKDAVEEIYDNYNGLTAEQQALVTNIDKLNSAKTKIEKIENDIAIAEEFDADAEALGDVTLDDEDAVKDLREKYTALTNDQKAYVTTLEILVAAEEKIVDLKAAKAFDDAVDAIYADGITIEDDAAIIAARKAYADLSETQQGYVTKLAELEEAETKIEELKAAADKEALDKAAALGVDNMIANLPEVITIDSEKAVKAARDAYEVLTDDQKEYVENLEILEEAEAKIQTIKEDMAAAKAVDDAIAALGEITIEDERAIESAREAYDALTEEQLAYVKNLAILEDAEDAIIAIKEDMAAASAVDDIIAAIGEVEYTEECKAKIARARNAYKDLTDAQKAYVANLELLENAEETYKTLVPDASQTEEAIGGYGDVYVTVFTDIEEGKKVVLGGNTAMMIKLGEDTYYVVITDEKVDADTVVVTNEPTEPAKLGDIDASGLPTETDAFAANKKAAQMDVALFANAYAYVLADVDGDGKITARDALMISRLASGEIDDTYLGLVTGK